MEKYEISKMLTVSTLHISFDCVESMETDEYVYSTEYGFILWVPNKEFTFGEDVYEHLKEFNELREIISLASRLGCRYVNIDRDGPELDELEKFYW